MTGRNKPQRYFASLITAGRVVNTAYFDALPKDAYALAHENIDPLTGTWVDIQQARQAVDRRRGRRR